LRLDSLISEEFAPLYRKPVRRRHNGSNPVAGNIRQFVVHFIVDHIFVSCQRKPGAARPAAQKNGASGFQQLQLTLTAQAFERLVFHIFNLYPSLLLHNGRLC